MSGRAGASRRSAVPPFAVMTVLQRVAEARAAGREVISLCAGEPSQGAPSDVRRRLAELMIDRTPLGYSETFGLTSLRRAIAGHYRRWYDLEVPIEQIAVTTGSSGAFLVSFLAAFDAGDRVLLARPGYPAYRNILCQPRLRGGGAPLRSGRAVPADPGAARRSPARWSRCGAGARLAGQPDRHHGRP